MSDNRSKRVKRSHWRLAMTLCVGSLSSIYLLYFLSFPLIEGLGGAGNGQFVRGSFILSTILLPDMLAAGWIGYGQLPVGFLDRLPTLLGAVLWLGIAQCIGVPWLQRADPARTLSRVERITIATLIGLALISTLTLWIGLAGQLRSRWPLSMSLLVILALSYYAVRRSKYAKEHGEEKILHGDARRHRQAFQPPVASLGAKPVATMNANQVADGSVLPSNVVSAWAARLVVVTTVLLGIVYSLGSLLPPWEFDVVEYHLQAPKEFYQLGRIEFLPHNIYANMPLGVEMHALAAMVLIGGNDAWWIGALIGKAIIGAHSLLAACLLGSYIARCYDRWLGWASACLLLAAPGNAQVAMAGLIDSVLGAYILAATIVYTHWATLREKQAETFRSAWFIAIVSMLAGAAAACKYPGLIYAVVPMLLGSVYQSRRHSVSRKELAQWIVAVFVGLGLTCGTWYAKNAMLANNPVYPLAYQLFGGRTLTENKARQWETAHRVPRESFVDSNNQTHQSRPYSFRALFKSAAQVLVGSPNLQPAMIVLLCLGIATGWRQSGWFWLWLALSIWILLVWWAATHRIDRFWLPILPLWAACAAVGARWLRTKVSHGLACAMLLIGAFYGVLVAASPVIGDNRFLVKLATLREDAGADEREVGRISPALAWINQHLDATRHRLALIGEARVFDYRVPIIYSTCFDTSSMETRLRGKAPLEQLASLKADKITHIFINWKELHRYRSPGNYGFSDWPTRESIDELIRSGIARKDADWPFDSAELELLQVDDR